MYSRVYIYIYTYICMPVFCQTYPNLCVKPKFFETKTLAFAAWSSIFPGQAVNYCFFWCKRNFVLGRVKTLHVSWDPLPQDASAPGGLDLWSMSFGPSDPGAPAGLEIYGSFYCCVHTKFQRRTIITPMKPGSTSPTNSTFVAIYDCV